jgi:hypothetical protein
VNEVATNALLHGRPPVQLTVLADVTTLTCEVVNSGLMTLDPVTGYRFPDPGRPTGLWAARQLVDDMFISDPSGGGCSVVLVKT